MQESVEMESDLFAAEGEHLMGYVCGDCWDGIWSCSDVSSLACMFDKRRGGGGIVLG